MGLIQAAVGALGGTFADQWKDFFTVPDRLAPTAAVFAAEKREQNAGRGSNTKGSDDIITNGSRIIVPEGYGLILLEQGAITGFAAEAGAYEWNSEEQDSQSIFAGDGIVSPLIKTSWERFKFGGRPGAQQRAYFVTLKELPNNRFGTQSEIYWDDAYMNAQVGAVTRGTYTLKITDPILFMQAWMPAKYPSPARCSTSPTSRTTQRRSCSTRSWARSPRRSRCTRTTCRRATGSPRSSRTRSVLRRACPPPSSRTISGRPAVASRSSRPPSSRSSTTRTPASCCATSSVPTPCPAPAATRTCRRRSPPVSKVPVRTAVPPAWSARHGGRCDRPRRAPAAGARHRCPEHAAAPAAACRRRSRCTAACSGTRRTGGARRRPGGPAREVQRDARCRPDHPGRLRRRQEQGPRALSPAALTRSRRYRHDELPAAGSGRPVDRSRLHPDATADGAAAAPTASSDPTDLADPTVPTLDDVVDTGDPVIDTSNDGLDDGINRCPKCGSTDVQLRHRR
ncbi:MAG: hypothetical protein R2697_01045 [Ilumatobacteraceae bacterium]